MNLEKAIKQAKPFDCPYEKGIVNLMYTSGWLRAKMKAHFSELGLTEKQYNILRILNGAQKPVSTSFIRERSIDRLSDVSRIVDRMEKKQLIKKTSNKEDKRLVDVSITNEGKEMLVVARSKKEKIRDMLGNLSEKEIKQLNKLLDRARF